MDVAVDKIAEPLRSALRRENSEDPRRIPARSRIRFCLDQCTAVTVACILLLAVSVYLLTQSDQMLKHIDSLLQKLLTNLTISHHRSS